MRLISCAVLLLILFGCGKSFAVEGIPIHHKALGTDISLLPNLEDAKAIYEDKRWEYSHFAPVFQKERL